MTTLSPAQETNFSGGMKPRGSIKNIAELELEEEPASDTMLDAPSSLAPDSIPEPSQAYVGSKSLLIPSSDGRSIHLADETCTAVSPVFRNDVRNEWVDAIFGQNFFPKSFNSDYVPPRQGVGLSQIPSYVAYTAIIPAQNDASTSFSSSAFRSPLTTENKKIGITFSRIPIGVYVRSVDVSGEAYAAGVVPGSVLVDINGLGVVGEPSHKLLERLWQYEGHFNTATENVVIEKKTNENEQVAGKENTDKGNGGNRLSDGSFGSNITQNVARNGGIQGPVALRLVKDGVLYTTVLLTKAPFGISWAPCGNFALVQRSYSFARNAGVRRGCIVAAVNGKSFRDLDHQQTAVELKRLFLSGEKISMTLAYTPAASRTGHFDRSGDASSQGGNNGFMTNEKTTDGVRIRRASKKQEEPLEYGIGSFFSCGNGNPIYMPISDRAPVQQTRDEITSLANRVAAGEVPAPTGLRRGQSFGTGYGGFAQIATWNTFSGMKYSACPTLGNATIISRWDALDSLVFCLRMHLSGYSEDGFTSKGGVIGLPEDETGLLPLQGSGGNIPLHTEAANLELIKSVVLDENAGNAFTSFLIQIVSLLASKDLYEAMVAKALKTDVEFKGADACSCSDEDAISLRRSVAMETMKLCGEIVDSILEIAMSNDELCQRFHFLLRAFMGEVESTPNSQSTYSPFRVLDRAQCRLLTRLADRSQNTETKSTENFTTSSMRWAESSGNSVIWSSMTSKRSEHNNIAESLDGNELQCLSFSSFDAFHSVASTAKKLKSKDGDADAAPATERLEQVNSIATSANNKSDKDLVKGAPKTTSKKSVGRKIMKIFNGKSVKKDKGLKTNEKVIDHSASETVISKPESTRIDDLNVKHISNELPTENSLCQSKKLSSMPLSILRKEDSQYSYPEPLLDIQSTTMAEPYALSMPLIFENMTCFLSKLDALCATIEGSLLKSFSQKITDWALQPWSASKDRALANVTADMRAGILKMNIDNNSKKNGDRWRPLMNPTDSSELLVSLDPDESFILPSAHFPLLLSFNMYSLTNTTHSGFSSDAAEKTMQTDGFEALYRTRIEVIALRSDSSNNTGVSKMQKDYAYVVHAAVAGAVQETGRSTLEPYHGSSVTHRWHNKNVLDFEICSSWGHPKTASLRVSSVSFDANGTDQVAHTDDRGYLHYSAEIGFSWIDLTPVWEKILSGLSIGGASSGKMTITSHAQVWSFDEKNEFDQQGHLLKRPTPLSQRLEIELRVTATIAPDDLNQGRSTPAALMRRRMLLYKHDDDMRQEAFAIHFLETCDRILKASGLDLKMKTYRCIPVGSNRGFVEWVPGTVSLSEVCKPMGSALNGSDIGHDRTSSNVTETEDEPEIQPSSTCHIPTTLQSPEFSSRARGWCKYESLRGLRQCSKSETRKIGIGLNGNNPVQEFLRSCAYDANDPYYISKGVMESYVKSCAGYCVATYLLGVGDRHLDNLLLHQNGHFLHCDYSFILGRDPKTYLPMRITEDMVNGMGGHDSDNYAKFLSLAGAAFITLRQHTSVRILLSLVRHMAYSDLADISKNQSPENAILAMRNRFRLDLSEDKALTFIEDLIGNSVTSKIWLAVDAIHSLSKHF